MKKTFSVSPRVLAHLGEDLIKNESIALLELVKNSYDACATECSVRFVVKKGELKKIFLSVDNHTLSEYRDFLNNNDRSIFYNNFSERTEKYPLFRNTLIYNTAIFFVAYFN